MATRLRTPLLLVALLVVGCGGSDNPTEPGNNNNGTETKVVTRIDVTPSAQTISYGDALKLTAVAYDQDGAKMTSATITWSSQSTDVATVDGSGNVTTVALGDAKIVATSGTVQGSATITVDYAHFNLQADQTSGRPFKLLRLTLPTGAPTLEAGKALTAMVGTDTVSVVTLSATELTLEVPDVAAGDYDLTVALDDFSLGEGHITVLEAPVIADPDAAVTAVTDQISARLDSIASVGAASPEDAQAAANAVTAFQSWYQAASADDRMAIARYIEAASAQLGLSPETAPPARSVTDGPARDATYTTYEDGEEANLLDVFYSLQMFAGQSLTIDGPICATAGLLSGLFECGVVTANTMLLTHTMLEYAAEVRRLAEDPIIPTGNVSVKPASDPGAEEPLDFANGSAVPLVLTADHRQVNAADLGAAGTVGTIAATVQAFHDQWFLLVDWLSKVQLLVTEPIQISDAPPALADESMTANLPLNGAYVSFQGTDNPAVGCSMENSVTNVVLTCDSDEAADQVFGFGLAYDAQAFSTTVVVAATLHTGQDHDPCAEVGTLPLDGGAVQGELTDADCVDPGRPDAADGDVSGAYDTYILSSTKPLSFRFDLTSPDFTPMIDVLTAAGTYIVDDTGDPDLLTRLTLPAGSYEVRVYAADGSTLGMYTLSATSDPNTVNGCGRHFWNYFVGSVSHGGSIVPADCQNMGPGLQTLHWDLYTEWVEAGQTVTATLYYKGDVNKEMTLSLYEPGDDSPKYQDAWSGGHYTLERTATATGWFDVFVLAQPVLGYQDYTVTIGTSGPAGAPGRAPVAHGPARSRIPLPPGPPR